MSVCDQEYQAMNDIYNLAAVDGKQDQFPKMMSKGKAVILDQEFQQSALK